VGGTLYATGKNDQGQLGLGDRTRRTSWTQVGTDTDWVDVSCGAYHTMAAKADGTVWGCGEGGGGRLGNGSTSDKLVFTEVTSLKFYQISAGNNFSIGIKRG